MAPNAAFIFVLHSHLPYVRRAGGWPHGEEMLYEAMRDSYIPLLDTLADLAASGLPVRLAVGITPILAEQLADGYMAAGFRSYMAGRMSRIGKAMRAYERKRQPELARLLGWYLERHQRLLKSFDERHQGNLTATLRRLHEAGTLELTGGPATHPYLPLLSRDSRIRAQLATGLAAHGRHFGHAPACCWLPECGYRPAYYDLSAGQARFRPGLESHLESFGLRAFFADSAPVAGVPAGAAYSSGGMSNLAAGAQPLRSTARPYLVSDSQVAVFGRDALTSRQVWSASEGYPGHASYREFHKRDELSGLRLWKITGRQVDLDAKAVYEPAAAFADVESHAQHFVDLVQRHVASIQAEGQAPPVIVAAYDTELFGHWWFEGVAWLEAVLRELARRPGIELTTPSAYLDRYPAEERIALPESSWGFGGGHHTWQNDRTAWMWPITHGYERQMEDLVARYGTAPEQAPLLRQAAREALLLQASDWPFLISSSQAADYASMRFRGHAARLDRLVEVIEIESSSGREEALAASADVDNPFPDIDVQAFAAAQAL